MSAKPVLMLTDHTFPVLPYFSHSPFFDPTSNNAIITTQAMFNPNLYYLIQTREAFEGRLRTMQGLEYMVSHDPSDNGRIVENTGVWVIRKQIRRKRPTGNDDLTPISSYFVVGENIYMAPSVGNVLGSRLVGGGIAVWFNNRSCCSQLSTVKSLTDFLSTASELPNFTPSTGHTYLTSGSKGVVSVNSTQVQTSKDSTPMPATQDTTTSTKSSLSTKTTLEYDLKSLKLLAESFSLSSRYGSEYMDENPLVGEPGSFILSKSRDTPASAQQRPRGIGAPPKISTLPESKSAEVAPTMKKGFKTMEKSPASPSTKEKKQRRKSKVAGATTTPKWRHSLPSSNDMDTIKAWRPTTMSEYWRHGSTALPLIASFLPGYCLS